jgi:hypothetical protein
LKTPEGRSFAKNVDKSEPLSIKDKKKLSQIFAAYILEEFGKCSNIQFKALAQEIAEIFPKEDATTYFGKPQGGYLYNKFYYLQSKSKKEKPDNSFIKMSDNRRSQKISTYTSTMLESDAFVKSHPQENTDMLKFHWQNSSGVRRNLVLNSTLEQVIEVYKTFSRSDGYMMVSLIYQIYKFSSLPIFFFCDFTDNLGL